MRVLLAHASSATRRRLTHLLDAAGHDVTEAVGAAQALALCRDLRPDVLVADVAMCDRDGIVLLDAVKADAHVFRTAVVLIAPAELPAEAAAAYLRRGAQDFLLEPVREAELAARVQAAGRTKILQEELVEQSQRLEAHLFADPLTSTYNRRFVLGQLQALASGARRHGRPLALAMVDLDGFKAVNDSRGHEVGDAVLVAVADALARAIRAEDVLGRLGGEEFLVLLPDTDEQAAAHAAERLREAVAAAPAPVPTTASVGWAVVDDEEPPEDAVRRADAALYAAKAAGRNRVMGPATLPRRT